MTKKYIHTDMGVFVEDDEEDRKKKKPGRCPHCGKKQKQLPACLNISELVEMAHVVVEERCTRDDVEPCKIDFMVACGLLRRGYTRGDRR